MPSLKVSKRVCIFPARRKRCHVLNAIFSPKIQKWWTNSISPQLTNPKSPRHGAQTVWTSIQLGEIVIGSILIDRLDFPDIQLIKRRKNNVISKSDTKCSPFFFIRGFHFALGFLASFRGEIIATFNHEDAWLNFLAIDLDLPPVVVNHTFGPNYRRFCRSETLQENLQWWGRGRIISIKLVTLKQTNGGIWRVAYEKSPSNDAVVLLQAPMVDPFNELEHWYVGMSRKRSFKQSIEASMRDGETPCSS